MGKASRIKQQSAREKIAAQREAARKAERRNRMVITGGSTLVVLVIVAAFIVIKLTQGSAPQASSSTTGTLLPATVSSQVTGVPAATLDKVGKGTVPTFTHGQAALTAGSGAALTSGGKPQMLYIGAEFCPYCAATRWSMAVALSRFGTLTPLHGIRSSSTDTDPNTATLTFYKTGYNSKYLNFTPVEVQKVDRSALQNPTSAQNAVWAKYEPDPNSRGYPFIAFGNKLVMKGPIFDAAVLQGKSWSQIAAALKDPTSPIAQSVDGAANYITGAICKMTNNQPSDVCSSPAVTAVQSGL
jgi:Domain of unknown function (DUF929)